MLKKFYSGYLSQHVARDERLFIRWFGQWEGRPSFIKDPLCKILEAFLLDGAPLSTVQRGITFRELELTM